METQQARSSVYEKTIINIMHKLPEERITELVNFARFLEFQYVRQEENIEREENWNRLLAKPEAKRVMREMAYEALDEYRAGKTTDIAITEDGRLAPA